MMATVLTIKERIEYSQKQKEIKFQWNTYKQNKKSLTDADLEVLKSEAKKYNVVLH